MPTDPKSKTSGKKKDLRQKAADLPVAEQDDDPIITSRDSELLETLNGQELEDLRSTLATLYADVEKGFENQWGRSNDQIDYWQAYNCKLGENQFYSGTSKIFVPIVHDAVNARITRFTNQIFPSAGRYVEVISEDGTKPDALMSLLEFYVRKTRLRTKVTPALLRNGDIEGQFNLYVGWTERKRHVVWRTTRPAQAQSPEGGEPVPVDGEEVTDIQQQTLTHGYPDVEVLADGDVVVSPATADSLEEALYAGGSVTVLRRWSKAKIKRMAKEGHFIKEEADKLLEEFDQDKTYKTNKPKEMVDAAGIKGADSKGKIAQIYETWTLLTLKPSDVGDEVNELEHDQYLCRVFFGGPTTFLGCKRNPYWADKLPILSVPVDKVQGSFKGVSKVKPTIDLQYQANDATNEAMDSAAYALMPIVMTDPNRNPRVGSMVLSLASIWLTDPQHTQFVNMPPLWKDGLEIVASCKAQIFQTLSVNPSMLPQQAHKPGSKRSQAEVAQDQQVDILATADAVTVLEEGIYTPLLQRFMELDHQYRDEDLTVRQFGEMGLRAKMEKIPPLQMDRRYSFRWFGVEQVRNMQQIQQQVGALNILRGITPELIPGHRINLVPLITNLVENTFGPRLAPLIFEDMRAQLSIPPEKENEYLAQGLPIQVHLLDNDQQHIAVHQQAMQATGGDPSGQLRAHIMMHMQQLQLKNQAAVLQHAQQTNQQQPNSPGQPRMGAQPRPMRPAQGPPGQIAQDTIGPRSGQPPRLRQAGGA